MMKCSETQEHFPSYWDMADDDFLKRKIDDHLRSCQACAEEFEFWKESAELIQTVPSAFEPEAKRPIASSVMERIYQDERWREPLHARTYRLSYAVRRNVSIAMAFFMGLFLLSFVYSLTYSPQPSKLYSTMQAPATAVYASNDAGEGSSIEHADILLASISEPPMIQVKSVQEAPNYYLVLSLLGMTSILLTMNWLSRVKA